jgi:hypothetical protein
MAKERVALSPWIAVFGLWFVGSAAGAGTLLALVAASQISHDYERWLWLTTPVLVASFWLGSIQLQRAMPRMRESAYFYFGFALFVGFAICWMILEVVI